MRYRFGVLSVLSILFISIFLVLPVRVSADPVLIRTVNGQTAGGTSVAANLSSVTANNLIVAVCGATTSSTLSVSGFTAAINQSGTPSQGIFYKVSTGGETTVTCSSSASTRLGIHLYEYSGTDTTSVLHTTGSATGTSATPSSGTATTSTAKTLLVAGITVASNTTISSWSNSFTQRNSFSNNGAGGSRGTYGGADRTVSSTGSYSTAASSGSAAWRGQIAAFAYTSVLSVDIVNSGGTPVASPSVSLSSASQGFTCQTTTGTLGTSSQKIRINNTTANPQWTMSIAATSGATSLWSSGSSDFDFNDGSGSPPGCGDGADSDSRPGRLTLDASVGTSTPKSGCSNTGISLGSSSSFAQGTTDAITLVSASSGAGVGCYWDITGISVSQTIPQEQPSGSYSLNLTLTVTAI